MSTLEIKATVPQDYAPILTEEALAFVADLCRRFTPRIEELLAARERRQAAFDKGERPDLLEETASIREDDSWQVAALPEDLLKRHVEITGPVDRKMIVNALNSGADVFMADFEDSNAPSWENVLGGQKHLYDAIRRQIDFVHPKNNKRYSLNETTATLMVRPRGLHLKENHLQIDGQPVPASLVDFGLFLTHNARELLARGSGPYFYLPKLESHHEARLWNDIFIYSQRALDLPLGTIKATVLLETITAAFEMEEILFALREHSAGLNCGRWDYIFSFIKKFRADPAFLMPDRSLVGMTQPFMRGYTQLVIKTCHKRGVHAMGGMAAQIPIKNDPAANEAALLKVRADKMREVQDGHDGTWVAHPGLVPMAAEIFAKGIEGDHQIDNKRLDVDVQPAQLLAVPDGTRSREGLDLNIRVGLLYLEAWLRGSGCVPIDNLMEDAATAEICRTQIWQWIHHGATLDDGTPITTELLQQAIATQRQQLADEFGPESLERPSYQKAEELFVDLCTRQDFLEFLTLPAYPLLLELQENKP